MASELPEELRIKMLKKLMKEISRRELAEQRQEQSIDPERLVWQKISDDKAEELLLKTKKLYPNAYPMVINVLANLILQGYVGELDGYTVYTILQRLGIPVRPETRIKFVKRGKEVDLKEYLGD